MAGYKAATAAMKADMAAEGNSIMDRKGGAPVPWQEFYGRTAKDFIMHDVGSPVYHQVQRPSQFDYIYHANNQQADAAKAEIAAMGAKIDALLARRRQLEAEQSSIWATIALESIGNRDLSLRALYRDELKAKPSKDNDNRPDTARLAAMRAAVLYLRTVDNTVTTLADQLDSDQVKVYTTLRDTLQEAQKTLRESAANFTDTPSVDPTEVKQMREIVAQAKRIQSLCKDVCDAFRKAADADAAAEEGRKLLYRATLQDSLFTFAEATGQLDETLTKMAEGWDIHALAGTKSGDQPLAVVTGSIIPGTAVSPEREKWLSKDATYTTSSNWRADIPPLPSLLTGEGKFYNIFHNDDALAFHTKVAEPGAHIRIDLNHSSQLTRIEIANRVSHKYDKNFYHSILDRAIGIKVWLSDDPDKKGTEIWTAKSGDEEYTIQVSNVRARYITIGFPDEVAGMLHLKTVKIYGLDNP